jgi:hypothetical protein
LQYVFNQDGKRSSD